MRQIKIHYFPHITDYNLHQAFSFKMMRNRFFNAIVFILNLHDATGSCRNIRDGSRPFTERRQQETINQIGYKGIMNASCRTKDGVRGKLNTDYEKEEGLSLSECMSQCSDSSSCEGFEHKMSGKGGKAKLTCYLWNHYGPEYEPDSDHVCFWKLTACCQPDPSADCTRNFEPVKCGANECEYDNYCLAEKAGWEEQECTARCLKPTNPDSCNEEDYNPVRCGSEVTGCEYENKCLANQAGYSEDSCEYICDYERNPGCTIACTLEENPVLCGEAQCPYANPCLGTKAAGFAESQCTLVGSTPSGNSTSAEDTLAEDISEGSEGNSTEVLAGNSTSVLDGNITDVLEGNTTSVAPEESTDSSP